MWIEFLLLGLVGENYRGYYSGKGKSGGGKFIGGNMGSKAEADKYSDLRDKAKAGDADAQKQMEAMRDKANKERLADKNNKTVDNGYGARNNSNTPTESSQMKVTRPTKRHYSYSGHFDTPIVEEFKPLSRQIEAKLNKELPEPTGYTRSKGSLYAYYDIKMENVSAYVFNYSDARPRSNAKGYPVSPAVEYYEKIGKTNNFRYYESPQKYTLNGNEYSTSLWAKHKKGGYYPVATFNMAYTDQPCIFIP